MLGRLLALVVLAGALWLLYRLPEPGPLPVVEQRKGDYKGPADTPLPEGTWRALELRAHEAVPPMGRLSP